MSENGKPDKDKVKWFKDNPCPNPDHLALWDKIDSARRDMVDHCTRRSGELSDRLNRLEHRINHLSNDLSCIKGKVDSLYKILPPLIVLILSFIIGLIILIYTRQPAWLPF